ncbi:ribosomal RNA small subunit methyltransferase A [Candidatus Kaiserbacteria bacterium]|nr:ribosomal RNA small subunit methyltransferase A [Candidatus Kaiserbacteria bacterium]
MRKKPSTRRAPRLGQHFLTGQWAARALVKSISVRGDETILEIGPGRGALTKELLATGARVVAVEKDDTLIKQLKPTFAREIDEKKLTLVADDIRNITPQKLELKKYVLAANIPYYLTGEIIRSFLTADPQPRALALLVQKEVAARIVTRDGKESVLSLSVKAYGTPQVVASVSRGNFSPPPSVDSAILLIDNVSRDFFSDVDEDAFFKVVRMGFASKRKLLSGNLARVVSKSVTLEALAHCGIPEDARAEDVLLEKWKRLTQQLSASS